LIIFCIYIQNKINLYLKRIEHRGVFVSFLGKFIYPKYSLGALVLQLASRVERFKTQAKFIKYI